MTGEEACSRIDEIINQPDSEIDPDKGFDAKRLLECLPESAIRSLNPEWIGPARKDAGQIEFTWYRTPDEAQPANRLTRIRTTIPGEFDVDTTLDDPTAWQLSADAQPIPRKLLMEQPGLGIAIERIFAWQTRG